MPKEEYFHNAERETLMDESLNALQPLSVSNTPTLVTKLQSTLREAIIRGDLRPGFRLRETQLAAHFECSVTPVREAIRKLEGECLVSIYPRRGAVVSAFSRHEVEDLYEIRLLVEPHTARKAAQQNLTAAELKPLANLIAQQGVASGAPDVPLDAEIHRRLAILSGNRALADVIGQTTSQIGAVQSRFQAEVVHGREAAHFAHREIFEAIAAGDGDLAEEHMREHIRLARSAVLASLDASAQRASEAAPSALVEPPEGDKATRFHQ